MIANAWGRPFLYRLTRKGSSEKERSELGYVKESNIRRLRRELLKRKEQYVQRSWDGKEITIF